MSEFPVSTNMRTTGLRSTFCSSHKLTLEVVEDRAFNNCASEDEALQVINQKKVEFMGCAACSAVNEVDYSKQDKRFCARCKCIVAYDHRCAPRLQYPVA